MKSLAVLLALTAVLTLVFAPAVSAKPDETLKCDLYIELNWNWIGFGGTSPYTWIGKVWGDINGEFYITLEDFEIIGNTEHFSETWLIVTAEGEIKGFDEGVWSFNSLRWEANGRVTSATGTWEYLTGYDMHYHGKTTEFPVPFGTPVNGTGTLIISSDS